MRIIVCMLVSMFFLQSVQADESADKVRPGKNIHPVKFSEFKKDGLQYYSYDFGSAVFTSLYPANQNKLELHFFWPGLIPLEKMTRDKAKESSSIRVRINFEDGNNYPDGNDAFEYWQKHNCPPFCYQKVESEYTAFSKYTTGVRQEDIFYIAIPDGLKSPQNTPLVIACMASQHTTLNEPPVNRQLKDFDCGVNFHYYNQISVAVSFRGDVMPQVQEFVSSVDAFLRSNMFEKN